jgi:hypothetical protein
VGDQSGTGAFLRVPRQLMRLSAGAIQSLVGRRIQQDVPTANDARLSFLAALPRPSLAVIADDLKFLIGWVSEAASISDAPVAGQLVDAASTFPSVPGFTSATDMSQLKATYRVAMPPLTGLGYYGLVLAQIDEGGNTVALHLINRLFRLPQILREPLGVMTDIVTVGGLLVGLQTPAVKAAAKAVQTAYQLAKEIGVPLITAGQSLAGGLAQYQVAALIYTERPDRPVAGFVTFNAAYIVASIEALGMKPGQVPGINFSKDRDPGVGPHSLLPNRVGVQIYIRPNGTGSLTPGPYSLFSALFHPWEHFLGSFARVELGNVLRDLSLLDR